MNVSDSCKNEVWLTPDEARKRIPGNPSGVTVRKWAKKGYLGGAIQLPNGHWQIPVSAIDQLLKGA